MTSSTQLSVSVPKGYAKLARVAAITGAGSGIGEATAYKLAMDGFDVVILDIDMAKAETVAQNVIDRGGSALPLRVDVTRIESIEGAFGAIRKLAKITGRSSE